MNLLPDQLPSRYWMELPPRRLDVVTQAILLCGDLASQLGWLLLALGSVFFWQIALHSEAKLLLEERNVVWRSKAGLILSAEPTSTVEGKEQVWKYSHSFGLEGERYFGESYSVGKKFDPQQIAYIRYDAHNPAKNHLVGLRRFEFSSRSDWFLLAPLFGFLLVLLPVRQNIRIIRLLKIGDFTRGRLVDKYLTGQSIKKGGTVMPEFRYQFEFEHNGTRYLASCHTHETNKVEDEETEIILFDRYKPHFNMVYDAVQNIPHIGDDGKTVPLRGLTGWVLFLPVFTVAFNFAHLLLD